MEFERLRRLRNATLANLSMSIASVGVFAVTGNGAFIAEALHDGADTGAHGSRYLAEKSGINQDTKKFKWFLRAGLLGVSALSAVASVKFGNELLNGEVPTADIGDKALDLGAAVGIGLGNTYAYSQVKGIEEHSHASEASFDHAKVDMLASWGLAGFIVAYVAGADKASQVGGMLFAGYTAAHLAWHALRPHKH